RWLADARSGGAFFFSAFFFFSSRRRHTRFKCDWSSDVCSSDLLKRNSDQTDGDAPSRRLFTSLVRRLRVVKVALRRRFRRRYARSEERRVGKEDGAWGRAGEYRNNEVGAKHASACSRRRGREHI